MGIKSYPKSSIVHLGDSVPGESFNVAELFEPVTEDLLSSPTCATVVFSQTDSSEQIENLIRFFSQFAEVKNTILPNLSRVELVIGQSQNSTTSIDKIKEAMELQNIHFSVRFGGRRQCIVFDNGLIVELSRGCDCWDTEGNAKDFSIAWKLCDAASVPDWIKLCAPIETVEQEEPAMTRTKSNCSIEYSERQTRSLFKLAMAQVPKYS